MPWKNITFVHSISLIVAEFCPLKAAFLQEKGSIPYVSRFLKTEKNTLSPLQALFSICAVTSYASLIILPSLVLHSIGQRESEREATFYRL